MNDDLVKRLWEAISSDMDEYDFRDDLMIDAAHEIFELRNRIAHLEQALDGMGYLRAISAIMEEPK